MATLLGANMPFVLRPVPDDHRRKGPRWRLLGECYVHGIMDGELVEIDETTEDISIKNSTIQDFIIE